MPTDPAIVLSETVQAPADPSSHSRPPEPLLHSRGAGSDGTAAVPQLVEDSSGGDAGPIMREREGTGPVSLVATTSIERPAAAERAGGTERPALNGEPVQIELLLLSGKRKRWTFGTEETVAEVKDQVWHDWPDDWTKGDPAPASVDGLRLLHLGRFLDDASTLSAAGLKPSPDFPGPLIVHLHIRTLDSPHHAHHSPKKKKKAEQAPREEERSCTCCIIA